MWQCIKVIFKHKQSNLNIYSTDTAKVIVQTITLMNHQFAQTYSLMKSIKVLGDKGRPVPHKEIKQLHDCISFKLILIKELLSMEKRQAMESHIFLTEKKDWKINARTCTDRITQGKYTNQEEAATPIAITGSHLITAVIDAKCQTRKKYHDHQHPKQICSNRYQERAKQQTNNHENEKNTCQHVGWHITSKLLGFCPI
jgi:hypothetical protein